MASQLALYEAQQRSREAMRPARTRKVIQRHGQGGRIDPVLCAECQAREARYGFRREGDDPQLERPRALCFECFRLEIERRQQARPVQVRLPLDQTLDALRKRRGRAQIAARHALGLR